jgi:tetratricopeptide (TPR) repeat protein
MFGERGQRIRPSWVWGVSLACLVGGACATRAWAQAADSCPDADFAKKTEALRAAIETALSAREPDLSGIERDLAALWLAVPDSPGCRMLLAEPAMAIGSPLAISLAQKTLAANPDHVRANLYLSLALLNHRETLQQSLGRLRAVAPKNYDVQYLDALDAFAQKDFRRVDKLLSRAGPADYLPEELYLRARAQVLLRNPNAARFMFQQLLTMEYLGTGRSSDLPTRWRGNTVQRQIEAFEWLAVDAKKRADDVSLAAYGFLALFMPASAAVVFESKIDEKTLLGSLRRLQKNRTRLQAARELVLVLGADRNNPKVRALLGEPEKQKELAETRLTGCATLQPAACRLLFPELSQPSADE